MTREQFHRYQEQSFDSFIKLAIRNESANAHNKIAARAEKETTFSSLSSSELNAFSTVDVYHPYCKRYHVRGNVVPVYDETLGELLQHISPKRREILLLCYFLGYNDYEIGRMLHIDHKTVEYRRSGALRRLRDLLKELSYTLPENYEVQHDKMHLNPDDTSTLLLSPSVKAASAKRTPVLFEPDYFPIRAIAQSLHLSDKYVGNIVMDEIGAPFRDGDYALIHFLGQCIEKYLRRNNILSLGRPFEFEEIMTAILQHRLVEETKLNLFLDSLDFSASDSFFCIVITPNNPDHNRTLLPLLSLQISQATQSKCYLEFESKLIYIFHVTPDRTREDYLQIVLPILREYYVRCGISLTFRDFTNLYYYHWQCLRALELGQKKNPTYWFYRFENYMLDHLIKGSCERLIPQVMMPEGLIRLAEYDQNNGSDYLHILRVYLDHNTSLTAAARALYVHKNTLLYRLERIKEILQMNLEDPDVRLLLSAALRMQES